MIDKKRSAKVSNLVWAVIFLTAIFICVAVTFIINRASASCATVYVDGEEYLTIDNLNPNSKQEYVISNEFGSNTICVFNGEVWVEESDCDNQTCVNFGKISSPSQSIICAPHKLVVKISGENSADLVQ